jgi:hypothetical protein
MIAGRDVTKHRQNSEVAFGIENETICTTSIGR